MGGPSIQDAISWLSEPTNHMIFLFRKFNKQIITTQGAQAWEAFKSNGDWKHRPTYLGAISEEEFSAVRTTVQETIPR